MKHTLFSQTALMILLFLTPFLSYAGPGTTAAQFLSLGGGTRATALGDTFTAISGDVTSALWNPSGLAGLKETQAALSYNNAGARFGSAGKGIYYGFFTAATPAGEWGVIGTTLQLNGQGEIEVTLDSPTPVGQESLGTNWAWTVSYADKIIPGLVAGINGKIIQQKLASPERGGSISTAYAIDFGVQYTYDRYSLGAAVQNWGTPMQFKDENQKDPLPRTFKIGSAATLYEDKYGKLRLVGDLTAFIHKLTENEKELDIEIQKRLADPKYKGKTEAQLKDEIEAERGVGVNAFRWGRMQKGIGAEYWLEDILALRVGYKDEPGLYSSESAFSDHLTFGFGIKYANYQLDYANFYGGGSTQNQLHTFDLLIRF